MSCMYSTVCLLCSYNREIAAWLPLTTAQGSTGCHAMRRPKRPPWQQWCQHHPHLHAYCMIESFFRQQITVPMVKKTSQSSVNPQLCPDSPSSQCVSTNCYGRSQARCRQLYTPTVACNARIAEESAWPGHTSDCTNNGCFWVMPVPAQGPQGTDSCIHCPDLEPCNSCFPQHLRRHKCSILGCDAVKPHSTCASAPSHRLCWLVIQTFGLRTVSYARVPIHPMSCHLLLERTGHKQ